MNLRNLSKPNFPGGEVNVQVDAILPEYTIRADIRSSDNIMQLLMATDALRRTGMVEKVKLVMPYVPYARQDRQMVHGDALSIKVFCDLINAQKYDSVHIWDPHSEVTPALLNNCRVLTQDRIVTANWGTIADSKEGTILVCPDAGARKKFSALLRGLWCNKVVYADKTRQASTGNITATTLGSMPEGFKGTEDFVIVDDICDGGYTFLQLAKLLRPLTTGKIKLYVTHGIFSKGLGVFNVDEASKIDAVYTANPWTTFSQSATQLTILPADGIIY